MITKEQFDAWLEALRSGDYKQGTGRLCRVDDEGNEEHCCLGVLAEVIGMDKDDSNALRMYAVPGDLQSYSSVMLDSSVLPGVVQTDLSRWNDNGHNFAFIADEIECREDEIVGSLDGL